MPKKCSKCNTVKDDSNYLIDKRWGTRGNICSLCRKAYHNKRYNENIRPTLPIAKKVIRTDGMKLCLKCNIDKPITDFYTHGGNTCKVCHQELGKERKKQKPEQYKEAAQKYRKKKKKDRLEYNRKHREKNKELYNSYTRKYSKNLRPNYIRNCSNVKGLTLETKAVTILIKRINKVLVNNNNV